jgi:hypothetical protein
MTIDLDELERLEREATAGPWFAEGGSINSNSENYHRDCGLLLPNWEGAFENIGDATFIAALRNAAPALIARARRADELEKENAWLQEAGTVLARRVTGLDDAMFHYDPPLDDD